MNFNRLKGAVYARGMTMQEMAEKAGIVYSTLLRQFEKNNLTITNLKKIKDVLCLSRDEIDSIFFTDEVAEMR